MGIFHYISDTIAYRALNEFIHPYWDIQDDSRLKQQPGLLLSKFREIALNPKVYNGFKAALRSELPLDPIDNIFVNAANEIPSEDLYEMAICLSESKTFFLISHVRIEHVLNKVCERCPPDKRDQILNIFKRTSSLRKFIES